MPTRNDRVLNMRIPEELDRELRQHAMKLELSVSEFVRDHLHRTVAALDSRAAAVERSIGEADGAARSVVLSSQEAAVAALRKAVLGWQEVTLQQPARCAVTGAELLVGTAAHLAIRTDGRRGVFVSDEGLDAVLGRVTPEWTHVVLQQAAVCARSAEELAPGVGAWINLATDPPEVVSEAVYAATIAAKEG
jgi:hypothetical protein